MVDEPATAQLPVATITEASPALDKRTEQTRQSQELFG